MFNLYRLRYQHLISDFPIPLLDEMLAYDPRFSHFESTASTPSLRATDHDLLRTYGVMAGPQPPTEDSANVKVVVRVRQFVKRGMPTQL
jgi:hypothetical protein